MNLFYTLKVSCLIFVITLLSIYNGYGQVDCSTDAPVLTIIENTIFEGEEVEIHFTGDGPVTIVLSVSFLPFNVPIVMNSSPFFTTVPGNGTYEIIDSWNASCPGVVTGSPMLTVFSAIDLGPDITVCSSGSAISLDAGTGYTNYSWSNLSTGQINTLVPSTLVVGDNEITVEATNIYDGSTGFGSVNIHVLENPEMLLSNYNVEICEGGYELVSMTPTGGTAPYMWKLAAPHGGSGFSPIVAGSLHVNGNLFETGVWTITLKDANDCSGITSMNVLIHPTPEGYATQDQWVCPGETNPLRFPKLTAYDFDASHTLTWTNLNDNTTVGVGNNISVNPSVETVYQVTIMDAFGCFIQDELTVYMQDPLLCDGASLVPDLMNPNDADLYSTISFSNPFDNQLTINLGPVDAGDYSLKIWDIKGTHIKTIQIGEVEGQTPVSLNIDTYDWNDGNYILQFFNGKINFSSKIANKIRF